MNQTTHVAEVCLDAGSPAKSELAIVKCFHYNNVGWANEAICWSLAQDVGVRTPPRAALVVLTRSEVTDAHGPELQAAVKYAPAPVILWCASAVSPTRPVQQALIRPWELTALRTEAGKAIASLDAWVGNCDRIANNILYWTTVGGLVAIDHEKMAFNHDWTKVVAPHMDEMLDSNGKPLIGTKLLTAVQDAQRGKDKQAKKLADTVISAMYEFSRTRHVVGLNASRTSLETLVTDNFSSTAAANLLSFLDYRLTEDCLKKRFGFMI